jgi:hypothetical protein
MKCVQDLHEEYYLMKELNKLEIEIWMFMHQKTQYCEHVTSLHLIYRVYAILMNILASYFLDIAK